MRLIRIPGFIAYAAMAMWLLQIVIAPVGAEEPALSRAADHIAEVRAALVAAGAPAEVKVTLAAPDAIIPGDDSDLLSFDEVNYNPASGRFLLRAHAGGVGETISIAGITHVAKLLPVLSRDIERNELISETDIDWIESSDARAFPYVDDADLIVGKIARRALAKGAPLRKLDLSSPTLIRRGDIATVILEAPGLRLTQSAVAMGAGGEGDVITFRNVNSDREFKAVIFSDGAAKAVFRGNQNFASLD